MAGGDRARGVGSTDAPVVAFFDVPRVHSQLLSRAGKIVGAVVVEWYDVKLSVAQPERIGSLVNRGWHRVVRGGSNPEGIDVLDRDWDVLVILDACRFDSYDDAQPFGNGVSKVRSKGTNTPQFLRSNFRFRTLHDTVYVSSNWWYLDLCDDIDSSVHDYVTVPHDAPHGYASYPATVTETALEAAETYPDKRLIVHYMQPHRPYLGAFGRERFGSLTDVDLNTVVRRADATPEEVRRAYRENLEMVLEGVADLVAGLDGRIVVTADHGELLGERQSPIPVRQYGHPEGVYVDALVEVPWHVVQETPRRETTADEPVGDPAVGDEVAEQLTHLGYRGG